MTMVYSNLFDNSEPVYKMRLAHFYLLLATFVTC